MDAYFSASTYQGAEHLTPGPLAISGWATGQINGLAISGALARALEASLRQENICGFHLARWTVDLLRAARSDAPVRTTATIVRAGGRLCLVDAAMTQAGTVVARASALLLRPGGQTVGEVSSPPTVPLPPPPDPLPALPTKRLFADGGRWSTVPDKRISPEARAIWHVPIPVVDGEILTPIQAAASVADGANLVTNWGTADVEFINADITLHLSRLPDTGGLGLVRLDRTEHHGVTVGTCLMFDKAGVVGTSAMSCLANGRAAAPLKDYFARDHDA